MNGAPLAKIEGSSVYYYHNDHLATPQKMTDSTGAVVWAADYKPFGEATITVSTITNNLRFPGQYYDAETGNHYNYFRDYNPVTGRYVEADPLLVKDNLAPFFALLRLKPYEYVQNNPLLLIDLHGLADSELSGFGIGVEAMALIGYGRGTNWCCDGKNRWRVRWKKWCFGLGIGIGGGGSVTIGERKNCPYGYEGVTGEAAFGPVSGENAIAQKWSDVGIGAGQLLKIFVICIVKFTEPPAIVDKCCTL